MQPALESLPPQFFLTKTLDEIAEWLGAQRVRIDDILMHGEDDSRLRQQFGRLSHRWHPLLTDERLRAPELSAVHQLAVQALDITRLIYAELENERQGQTLIAPGPVLERLLDWNEQLLERVSAQLELLESTLHHAEDLHEAAEKLVTGHSVSPVWLVGLARRILLEMRPGPKLWRWMPLPGLSLSRCLPARLWKSEPEVYAASIQTARLVAWLGQEVPEYSDRLELLIVAALLSDIGFFRLERTGYAIPSELETRCQGTYRRHPSLGAALAAGVSDYSIDLSFLIAQHHERLDGTGYPHGLSRYKQSKEAQFLASLVRFQEIVSRSADSSSIEAAGLQAAFQLFLESAQGAWSTRATLLLAEALHVELPKVFDTALATGQPFDAVSFLEKRWTCHAGEPQVPAPHFLFSRPTGRTLSDFVGKVVRHDPKG